MIVKWPGKVKAGTVNDGLISVVYFLPTLVEVAGETPHPPLIMWQTALKIKLNYTAFMTY